MRLDCDANRCMRIVQTAETAGWSVEAILELQKSLVDTKQKGPVSFEWREDKFLTPFLENDPLLYSFDDDEEDDNDVEEFHAADKTMALQELLEGTGGISSSPSSSAKSNELADLTKVFQSLGEGIRDELANPVNVAAHSDDGGLKFSNGASQPRKRDKKDLKVTFAEVAKRELRNVNKDYFGSYSAFGIHREMLSDKVSTSLHCGHWT